MTTKPARFQFLCERRQLEFKHDIPSSLIGQAALSNPAMPEMFTTVMRPIVLQHAEAALQACEDKCSFQGCKRDATTIVATPMSYLHKADDPFVIIMTVACCGDSKCDKSLKQEAADLMRQMTGQPGQVTTSFGFAPISRNAKCYCGSSHKYKKCCGKEASAEVNAEVNAEA
ncbi:Protein translocase subunit SecA [Cytospora mali]|uniref:Protein translocase subunit SecA n=1 Tax=Cytospora mali TaxID=578113 RepID=A0A194UNV1_CYTMA|nr:Protein translocase subunit SecA [Valsa mali var. pyri (nom. inval.)]